MNIAATKQGQRRHYWRYEYDAENMLVRVYKGEAAGEEKLVEEYTYGADGKRKEKISYQNGQAIVTGYIYLGENVIYEAGPKNKLLIWGTAQLLAEKEGGEVTYNHPDHLGSTSVRTDAEGKVVSFVGTKPYGTFYNLAADRVWSDEFSETSKLDLQNTTAMADTATGKVISSYTTESCEETLHAVEAADTIFGPIDMEVKSWSFFLTANDYRRELKVEADIEGSGLLFIKSAGRLRVELVKPDGSRELICSGGKEGSGAQLFRG